MEEVSRPSAAGSWTSTSSNIGIIAQKMPRGFTSGYMTGAARREGIEVNPPTAARSPIGDSSKCTKNSKDSHFIIR